MNLFHTLRRKAEFADIVFICAGPAVLDKLGKFDYTTIRKALCLQTTSSLPDQSRENDRSSWGTLRRSFFLAFFIVMVLMCDRPCDLECNKNCSAKKRQ